MSPFRKLIGICCLLGGLTCIAIPVATEWRHMQEVNELEEAISMVAASQESNVDTIETEADGFSATELQEIMELEIPSLDLKQYVLNETTPENLNLALTQIKEKQVPGKGNFTIAGHRGYRDGRHFSNLDEVADDELIYLHAGENTYIYKVTSKETIEATDVHVLEDNGVSSEITLITCTPSGKKRIAVKGELIDEVSKLKKIEEPLS
ncbi:class D sortase [Planococcus sp. CAU13]|uniref:class D sortase n=1 Tax=Planococcus sp. CAU13 TaxID=1541197 RepID=UPI00052FF1E0|nr:class D sortase [Planococcus sp. CAU13]